MTKEGRVVAITSMTLLMYALNTFFQSGQLVFPFPLNELFFLVAALIIAFRSIKKEVLLSVFIIVAAISGVFSQEFYWSFFYDDKQMVSFSQGITKDLFQILHHFTITGGLFVSFSNSKIKPIQYITYSSILIYFLSVLLGYDLVSILVIINLIIINKRYFSERPIINVWILYFILSVTKYWTLVVL